MLNSNSRAKMQEVRLQNLVFIVLIHGILFSIAEMYDFKLILRRNLHNILVSEVEFHGNKVLVRLVLELRNDLRRIAHIPEFDDSRVSSCEVVFVLFPTYFLGVVHERAVELEDMFLGPEVPEQGRVVSGDDCEALVVSGVEAHVEHARKASEGFQNGLLSEHVPEQNPGVVGHCRPLCFPRVAKHLADHLETLLRRLQQTRLVLLDLLV